MLPRPKGQNDIIGLYGSVPGQRKIIEREFDPLIPGYTGQTDPKDSTDNTVKEKPAGYQGAQQCKCHPCCGSFRARGTMIVLFCGIQAGGHGY